LPRLPGQPKKRNFELMSELTAEQCRAARALLNWSQHDLAAKAKAAQKTIADFEQSKRDPRDDTITRLQAALEKAGVEFIAENGGGPGVRLKKKRR
jgi:transcriptional regulator with XRE-family HTH domain